MTKDYTSSNEFQIQDSEYTQPYHYNLRDDSGYGIEYYSYLKKVESLISDRGDRILDFGCGEGFFCNRIYSEFEYVFGVDLSERAIGIAKNKSKGAVFLHTSSTKNLDEKNFDVITMIEVLEHIEPSALDEIMKYLYKHLTDDGLLIITVPSMNLPLQEKHFQHFNKGTLLESVSPWFNCEKIYGHYKKPNIFYKILKNTIDNQFYRIRIKPINNYLKKYFRNNLETCDYNQGYRLIATFSKNNDIN